MRNTLLGAIAIVLTVIFSACNSRSAEKIKAETDSLQQVITMEAEKQTPTLADTVIERGKNEAKLHNCFFLDDRTAFVAVGFPAEFIEQFPNEKEYTKKETTDSIRLLISLMESLAPYKNDTSFHFSEYPTGKEVRYMSLDMVIGTMRLTVWRTVGSKKLCYMSIESINDGMATSISDEDCDGLLQPKGGGDTYRWPGAEHISTWNFCKLPETQHQFANQKEMEIVRYLTRYLKYHFD